MAQDPEYLALLDRYMKQIERVAVLETKVQDLKERVDEIEKLLTRVR